MEQSRHQPQTTDPRAPKSRQIAERAVKLAKERGSWDNAAIGRTAKTWDQDTARSNRCEAGH